MNGRAWYPPEWRAEIRAHALSQVVRRLASGQGAGGLEDASWAAWLASSDVLGREVAVLDPRARADLRAFHDEAIAAYAARFVTGARTARTGPPVT